MGLNLTADEEDLIQRYRNQKSAAERTESAAERTARDAEAVESAAVEKLYNDPGSMTREEMETVRKGIARELTKLSRE